MKRAGTILSAVAALAVLTPLRVRAQRSQPQVATIVVEPLFGEEVMLPSAWSGLVVEVENLTSSDQRGLLRVDVRRVLANNYQPRRELPMHVPAHESRRVTVPLFIDEPSGSVRFRFEVDGRVVASQRRTIPYGGLDDAVVVFGDPPRLRGALLDLQDDLRAVAATPAVGVVRFDPVTGDPLLPEDAAVWSAVRLLVLSAPMLERVSPPQRRALEDWLVTGGAMLVFPRTQADLRRPWLRSLVGRLAADGEPLPVSRTHPAGGVRFGLRCVDGQREERFGCSQGVGFGRVFVAAHDGTSPSAMEAGTARAIVIALLHDHYRTIPERSSPGLSFARGSDEGALAPGLRAVQRLVDPNEGFRPALVLISLVLMLYVVLIGPLNFRWVKKQKKPTLALITTPLIALGCVLVLGAVGYLGKGVAMRYRRVEFVDLMEGTSRAAARRYTGLFSTRPGRFDVRIDPGVSARQILASGAPARHRASGDDLWLAGFRAGLWETSFVREDRVLDVGGELHLERDGDRIAELVNDTRWNLLEAVLIDERGGLFPLGDIAAGARAAVPIEPERSVELAHVMGRSDDDVADQFLALVQLLPRPVPAHSSVIYARLQADGADIGPFSAEFDTRFVRIAPMQRGLPIEPPPLEIPNSFRPGGPTPSMTDPGSTPAEPPGAPPTYEEADYEEAAGGLGGGELGGERAASAGPDDALSGGGP